MRLQLRTMWRWAVLLLSLLCSRGLLADGVNDVGPAAHLPKLESLQSSLRTEYDATVEWYGNYIEQRPFDAVAAVEHCRFLEAFGNTYEYIDWSEDVYEDRSACSDQLTAKFPEHPEVALYQLENDFGDTRVQKGEALLEQARLAGWTDGQRARLYQLLASSKEQSDLAKARVYALQALDADVMADVRLIAARGLIAASERDQAREVLLSPFDGHDASDYWYASQKMELLISLGELSAAERVFAHLKSVNANYDHFSAAKLLQKMNALDAAREELAYAGAKEWGATAAASQLFQLEYEHGTPQAALDAYQKMRDHGFKEDPLSINRVALLSRDWSLPWQARDFLGFAAAFGIVAGVSLFVLVPVGLVHYRGLARREKRSEPPPSSEGWQLRHAWMAMTMLIACQIFVLYTAGPVRINFEQPAFGLDQWEPDAVARLAIIGEVMALLFAAVIGMQSRNSLSRWHEHWSLTKVVGVALGVAILFRVPTLLSLAASPESLQLMITTDPMLQMVKQVRDQFGLLCAMWWIAVAAPVLEEFIFRGVLRESFAKHISIGWANTLQAALFALWHQSPKAFPVLFLVGLVAGTLARRSGGLLASILMHATFNLILGVILFWNA